MNRDDQPLLERLGLALTPLQASPSPEEVAALHRAVARRFGGSHRAFWRRPIFGLAAAATLMFACTAIVVAFCASVPTQVRAIAEAVGLPVQAPAPTEAPVEAPAADAPHAFTPAKNPHAGPVISCEDDEDEQDADEDTSEPEKLVCDDDEGEEPGSSDAASDDDDDDGDDAGFRVPDDDEHEGVPAAGPCPKVEDTDADNDSDNDNNNDDDGDDE